MKNVFITGANRGLGLGFATHYLSQGNLVVAACRTPSTATSLHDLSKKYPKQLTVEILDVSDELAFQALGARLKKGEMPFDIVINNAGNSIDEPIGNWTAKNFAASFQVNVTGPALLIQTISSFIKEGTKLIQISSGRGSIHENQGGEDGLDGYGMSKAALNMLTRRMATKFHSRKIIVTSLNPGWVQTDMGGASATLTVAEAIGKMTSTIEQLSFKDSGAFLENDGSILSW